MESDYEAKLEIEGICDVENTVFVAVGQNVKESKSTLLWAFHSFPGKKLCLLHVHQPAHLVTLMDERFSANKLKQQVVKSCRLVERRKMQKLLNQYLLILDQLEVQACKVWTVMDSVEKGIMQIIAQHNVRRLVMGTTAVEHQAGKLSELKSKKAAFVCQQAPVSCHIWFTCNGCLVFAKCGDSSSHAKRIAALSSSTSSSGSSTTLLKSHEDANEAQVQCITALSSSTGSCGTPLLKSCEDANKDPSELKKNITVLSSSTSSSGTTFLRSHEDAAEAHLQCITAVSISTSSSHTTLLESCEDTNKDFAEGISRGFAFQGLEHSTQSTEEVASGFESLCMEEIKRRQEMEEILARQWQEIEKMKDLYAKCTTELQMVNDNIPKLESQLMESHSIKEELEEKIIQAVNLLVTFKEKRDKLQIERDNATRHNDELKNLVMANASDLSRLHLLEFTFWEINEATKNFDPSWKIGDETSGSVYKGFLHHLKVAIKMLPSHGCQGHVEFENEAWFLSRVRHPNVVTLIGICPESRSLIYEYLENESLEDCLLCRGKTPPLSWQTRMKIASEICSALVFLHSNTPSLIHGSLKPTNILLDANFVSKLSDIAIYRLIPKDSKPTYSTPLCSETDIEASAYIDPELLEAGELSTESDVYSFGVVILRLLTGRPAAGVVKDVKCALERDNFSALLDIAAGKWPIEQARNVAQLALRCCEQKREDRPDLVSEVWSEIELMKESWSSSKLGPKGPHRTPSHFVCPIFQEVMKDPHIAADGFTYEGDAIKGWINSGHETSPMTNLKLDHCDLLPNYALYYAIQEWQQQS